MRFHQLEVGAQFEFQGERYTKTTKLVAVKQSDGAQKFMQRSATVQPLGIHQDSPADNKLQGNIDVESVTQAHEKFFQSCLAAIKNTSLSKAEQTALTKALKAAQAQFLNELNQD